MDDHTIGQSAELSARFMGLYCLSSFSRRPVSAPLVRRPGPGWLCSWRPGCGARGARRKWLPGGP
eukprot:5585186-Alexandrium_andersonii.AAC.1